MRVLQFAFGGDVDDLHLPHNYYQNVVAYTGTHDNDTTVDGFKASRARIRRARKPRSIPTREFCKTYLNTRGEEIEWGLYPHRAFIGGEYRNHSFAGCAGCRH
jgi:4-alpha-glucanotransferase